MTYYVYLQNNTYGRWEGPLYLAVEADSEDEAWRRALENGAYEDPEFFVDCDCCGNRWNNWTWEDFATERECQVYLARELLGRRRVTIDDRALMVDRFGQQTTVRRLGDEPHGGGGERPVSVARRFL